MRGTRAEREQRARAAQLMAAPQNPRRASAGVDNGTIALALSGMAFYWMMPMMAGGRRKKRRKAPKPPEGGQQEQA